MAQDQDSSNSPFDAEPEVQDTALPSGASAHTPAQWYFEGATPCGPLGLWLTPEAPDQTSINGAELVMLLSRAEPLICAVEQWFQSPWDPCPAEGCFASDGVFEAVIRDPALAPPGTRLALPLEAVLAPPPHALQPPRLAWPGQVAEVVLASLAPEVLEQIEAGGLLWLPDSFGQHWHVHLHDPTGRLPPCQARFDMANQQILLGQCLGTHATPCQDSTPQPQVVLTRTVQVPLNHWLGWSTETPAYQWPMPQPWEAELRLEGHVQARGSLLPLGQGCGLWVEPLQIPHAA